MSEHLFSNSEFFIDYFFYNDFWPDFLFVNDYSILVIAWNIMLIFIPWGLAIFIFKYWRKNKLKKIYQKLIASFIFLLWLFFIPNAAYIITDVRHLLNFCPANSYFHVCSANAWQIMLFFIYALVGWVAFVLLLRQMKAYIIKIKNKRVSEIFIWLVIPLISFGVLLGLLERWNSWDLFIYPWEILESMLKFITDFDYLKNWLFFTVSLYILYFGGDWLFKKKFPPKADSCLPTA
ncbi:MAG: DUF1361 domain-containing protein [Patescibacteria group bacterium]